MWVIKPTGFPHTTLPDNIEAQLCHFQRVEVMRITHSQPRRSRGFAGAENGGFSPHFTLRTQRSTEWEILSHAQMQLRQF